MNNKIRLLGIMLVLGSGGLQGSESVKKAAAAIPTIDDVLASLKAINGLQDFLKNNNLGPADKTAKAISAKMDTVLTPANVIGDLLPALEQFKKELAATLKEGKLIPFKVACLKSKDKANLSFKVKERDSTGAIKDKVYTCKDLGCSGSRVECASQLLESIEKVLKVFADYLLVGFVNADGKFQEGMVTAAIGIANPEAKRKFTTDVVDPFKSTVQLISDLKANIKPTSTPSTKANA